MPQRLLTLSARTDLKTFQERLPPGWVIEALPQPEEDEIVEGIGDTAILLTGNVQITARVVEAAPELRLIQAPTGYNHIDLDAATRRGVYVANSGVNFVSVAELTMFFTIYLARNLWMYTRHPHSADWWGNTPATTEVAGKVLGLLGFGHIGNEVATRARALGMEVLACDPYVKSAVFDELGVKNVGFEELLRASDFLSLHLPLNDETRGLLGANELAMMKQGAFVVNTARGELVDEPALAVALRDGHLAGAALDVVTDEPPSADNPLLKLDNVLITPHIGGRTKDANRRSWELVVENIWRIHRGEVPRNLVNPAVLENRD